MYFKSQVDFAINYGQWDPNVRLLSGNYELYHILGTIPNHPAAAVSDTSASNCLHLYLPGNYGEMV